MKNATEWLNQVGEVFSAFAGSNPPGNEVEKLVKQIQADALRHAAKEVRESSNFQEDRGALSKAAMILEGIAETVTAQPNDNLSEPGAAFWDSPALKSISKHYPERFGGRVPMRIKMLMNVRPDPWSGAIGQSGGPGTILRYEETYECWTNSHGAVAGICANGFKLGVKPAEFEVVEWYMPNAESSAPRQ